MGRQTEKLDDPLADDLLDHGRGRPADVQPRVLVPRGRQPVRGDGRGQPAADHEPEVAAARDRDEAGVRVRGQLLHDPGRIGGLVGERAAERCMKLLGACSREDGALVQRFEEVRGEVCGAVKERANVRHALDSTRAPLPWARER